MEDPPKKPPIKKKEFSALKGISFCFTDFKEENIVKGYKDIFREYKDIIRGLAYGVEKCPKTGKLHNQSYIQFYTQIRAARVQKIFNEKFHIELMRGSILENEEYCSKEDRFTKLGYFVTQGYRSDFHNIKDDLMSGSTLQDIADKYTSQFIRCHSGIQKLENIMKFKNYECYKNKLRDIDCYTLTGKAGSGKTRYVTETYGLDNVFIIDGSGKQEFLFNGYEGQDVLLIDDFNGWIKYGYMLRVLDRYPLRLNIKNGHCYANWTKVYITSNNKPSCLWCNISVKDNFKRRISKCLEVTNGNTGTLVTELENPWEKDLDIDEYDMID